VCERIAAEIFIGFGDQPEIFKDLDEWMRFLSGQQPLK